MHFVVFCLVGLSRRESEISEIASGLIDVKVEEVKMSRGLYTSVLRTETALY